MENTQNIDSDYRDLIEEKIRTNFRSLLIGTFTLSVIMSLLYFRLSPFTFQYPGAFLKFTNDIPETNVITDLTKKVKGASISMSPQQKQLDSLAIAATENGQISAIATNQVTMKADKYTVKSGDSISSIALQAYGDLNAWPRIAQANKLSNPEAIEIGMVLIIPR